MIGIGLSQAVITLLLVLGAVTALAVLVRGLVHRWRQLTFPFWFALAAGLLLNGHSMASSLLHGRTTRLNAVLGQPDSVTAPWVDALYRRLLIVLIVVGLLSAFHYGVRLRRHVSPSVLIALTIFGIAALAGYQAGDGLFTTSQFALASLMLGYAFLPAGRPIYLGIGTFGVLVAALSGFMTLIDYNAAIVGCGYKCGALGGLYFGVLGNDNALGLLLAVTLPFAWLGFNGRARLVLTLYLAASVMVTGSRTAEVAVVATLVVLALAGRERSAERSTPAMLAVFAVLLSGMAIGVWLPLNTPDPSSYTGRGNLWQVAMDQIQGSQLVGLGTKAWSRIYEQTGTISSAATYSPHNEWLDIRFTTGWVGGGLFAILLIVLLRRSSRAEVFAVVLIIVPVAYIGITERAWGVGTADWLSFAYVAALAAVPRVRRSGMLEVSPDERLVAAGVPELGDADRVLVAGLYGDQP